MAKIRLDPEAILVHEEVALGRVPDPLLVADVVLAHEIEVEVIHEVGEDVRGVAAIVDPEAVIVDVLVAETAVLEAELGGPEAEIVVLKVAREAERSEVVRVANDLRKRVYRGFLRRKNAESLRPVYVVRIRMYEFLFLVLLIGF